MSVNNRRVARSRTAASLFWLDRGDAGAGMFGVLSGFGWDGFVVTGGTGSVPEELVSFWFTMTPWYEEQGHANSSPACQHGSDSA